MGYRQLPQTQRYQIHARYDWGISQDQIGRELGIHSSTISRELHRIATAGSYGPRTGAGPECEVDEALAHHDCRRRRPGE